MHRTFWKKATFSGGAGDAKVTPELGSSEKGAGAKPDFCSSEFSYYSKYLWTGKAIYNAAVCAVSTCQKQVIMTPNPSANSKGFFLQC